MAYNTSCPAVERFEDIAPINSYSMHASTLRDDKGKRYVVYADSDKVWPCYIYIFDEGQWYGMNQTDGVILKVRSVIVHACPAPTNMIRWQAPIVMAEIASFGLVEALTRKIVRAASGEKW